MQRGSKRITQCTPREAWMQLRDEDRDWIAGRLAERGKRYVERSPTLRLAAVDHTELLKDAVQHGLTYMVRWNGVKEWPRQELFWLARKPMIRFLQKERDKLLRRMGAPDPDQELVIEPKHDGEPEADVLRTHEIERIGRPFAEPPTRLPRGLLEAMKTFYERFTRMSTTNRVAVCNWLEHCWDDDDAFRVTEALNIEQDVQHLTKDLECSEGSLQKTRQRAIGRHEDLRKWLEDHGYGELLRDVIGPH